MNSKRFYSIGQPHLLVAAALALASVPGVHAQTTYTWTGTGGAAEATTTNWSPAGSPGPADTVTNGANSNAAALPQGVTQIGTIDETSTGWTFYTLNKTTYCDLQVTTINETVGGMQFRDNVSAQDLELDYTTVNITVGAIQFGGNGSTTGQELTELNPTGAAPGAVINLNGGSVDCDVTNDYYLGLINAMGTAGSISLINSADTGIDYPVSRNAYVTGLTGPGALTIYGGTQIVGGYATLNIANNLSPTPNVNYSSAAVLMDGNTAPAYKLLTLVVDLTGTVTQTLTGASTFSGGTTVAAGTLYVSNASGSGLGVGPVSVNAGATLGGSGTIAPVSNSVTINGTLSPGDLVTPTGTLTFALSSGNQLVLDSGSQIDVILGTASSGVAFSGSGSNWLSGTGNWTLNVTEGAGFSVGTPYTVFANANTPSFAPAAVTCGGQTLAPSAYAFTTDGTNYYISLTGPTITVQPVSASASAGQNASFTVAATGTGSLSYQWYFNGTALTNGTQADGSVISGATTATLGLSNAAATDNGPYTCLVTDSVGTVTSSEATLTVGAASPTITTQPTSISEKAGTNASFAVTATGAGTLAYQWYFDGTALANGTQADGSTVAGASTATLSISGLHLADGGRYTVAVTNSGGPTTSNAATLTILGDETIVTQPVSDTTAATGQAVTFTVAATGSDTLTYQWYFNGTALANGANIAGATASTLTLTDVQPSQVGSYTVTITDPSGSVTSTAVGLAGPGTASFQIQPVGVTLAAGQTASFYAPATGTGTVSYQWYLNGTAVASSTDAYLLVTPVSSTNAGSYTCIATDSTGSTLSEAAVLTLSASTDLGRLTNVSVRTNCGTGSANIITGFVIGGSGTDGSSKSMLIRADGPELANFGVPGFLPDPSLDVFNTAGSSPVSVGQNTGWCVTQTNENQVVAAGSAVYAFPLTTNSASSAVVLTLPSDSYTENVTGASGDTGIALAEVYDVSNATETYSSTIPRLVNVSARANVAPGAGNLIAGFTIGGSTDKTVLVRGTGPGLSEFGLTGLLDQPTLAVYSTSSGDTLVATNTGWAEDPVLAAAAASVYAFAQTSSADCSLLITLPPGTYTANLNSDNGASGLALVEVYEVP